MSLPSLEHTEPLNFDFDTQRLDNSVLPDSTFDTRDYQDPELWKSLFGDFLKPYDDDVYSDANPIFTSEATELTRPHYSEDLQGPSICDKASTESYISPPTTLPISTAGVTDDNEAYTVTIIAPESSESLPQPSSSVPRRPPPIQLPHLIQPPSLLDLTALSTPPLCASSSTPDYSTPGSSYLPSPFYPPSWTSSPIRASVRPDASSVEGHTPYSHSSSPTGHTHASPAASSGDQVEPRVKRPPNSFMLFRQHLCRHTFTHNSASLGGTTGHGGEGISKTAAALWHALPADERAKWDAKANEVKKRHAEANPGWRFNPRGRKRGRGNDDDDDSTEEGSGKSNKRAKVLRKGAIEATKTWGLNSEAQSQIQPASGSVMHPGSSALEPTHFELNFDLGRLDDAGCGMGVGAGAGMGIGMGMNMNDRPSWQNDFSSPLFFDVPLESRRTPLSLDFSRETCTEQQNRHGSPSTLGCVSPRTSIVSPSRSPSHIRSFSLPSATKATPFLVADAAHIVTPAATLPGGPVQRPPPKLLIRRGSEETPIPSISKHRSHNRTVSMPASML